MALDRCSLASSLRRHAFTHAVDWTRRCWRPTQNPKAPVHCGLADAFLDSGAQKTQWWRRQRYGESLSVPQTQTPTAFRHQERPTYAWTVTVRTRVGTASERLTLDPTRPGQWTFLRSHKLRPSGNYKEAATKVRYGMKLPPCLWTSIRLLLFSKVGIKGTDVVNRLGLNLRVQIKVNLT